MKPIKNTKHLNRVHELPCCITGINGVEAHHIRGPGITGAGQKASDWFAIPLTPDLHREYHQLGGVEWERIYGPQIRHVERTLERLYG